MTQQPGRQLSAVQRPGGAPAGNTNAVKSGLYSHAAEQTRRAVDLDEKGALVPEVVGRPGAWAQVFDTTPAALNQAAQRLGQNLASREHLPWNGLNSLDALGKVRLKLATRLLRQIEIGMVFSDELYALGDTKCFSTLRLAADDERRLTRIEGRIVEALADAAAGAAR